MIQKNGFFRKMQRIVVYRFAEALKGFVWFDKRPNGDLFGTTKNGKGIRNETCWLELIAFEEETHIKLTLTFRPIFEGRICITLFASSDCERL